MNTRDYRIDSIRGALLVIMTIDHFGSDLTFLTLQPMGYVSAAAGFVLLSAYTYAMTSRRIIDSLRALIAESAKRAVRIYKYHVLSLLLVLGLAAFVPLFSAYIGALSTPQTFVRQLVTGALLIHRPKFFDILPMYVTFALASPFIMFAYRRGYARAVFAISAVLWLMAQSFNPLVFLSTQIAGTSPGLFNMLAWQVLWVVGLYVGYVQGIEGRQLAALHPRWVAAALVPVALLFLMRHGFIEITPAVQALFHRGDLAILRLINIFCLLIVLLKLVSLFPRQTSVPGLALLGRYSLQTFSLHIISYYLQVPVYWRVEGLGSSAEIIYTVVIVACMPLPIYVYRWYEKTKQRPARVQPDSLAVRTGADQVAAMAAVEASLLSTQPASQHGAAAAPGPRVPGSRPVDVT